MKTLYNNRGDVGPPVSVLMKLCEQIRVFNESLEILNQSLDQAISTTAETLPIESHLSQLRAQFQQIIADLADTDIELGIEQRTRSYQTEAHRRLRLLGVEAMRLRTAKDPVRSAAVRSQLQDHLDQLRQFTAAIAAEVC
ncbi:MAG: heterocyst frequency control protein PatD [Cyanobacteria bacterium J06626_6]